jgi:glucose-1-phosphate adenylyltransferase
VRVEPGAIVRDSVLLTDCTVHRDAIIERSICDIRSRIGTGARVGGISEERPLRFSVVGKSAFVPPRFIVHAGAAIGPDVIASDIGDRTEAKEGELVETRRKPHEIQ